MPAFARSAVAAASLLFLAHCGSSSSTNVTAPTSAQCAVTLASDSQNIGASGGDGTLTISVNRECSWNAKPDVNWITLTAATGQGGATVGFHVGANAGTSVRRGGIGVNDRRVDITQAGATATCTYSLGRTEDAIAATGGKRTISVTAGPSCTWTAKSNASWIVISAGTSGTGNGSVTIDVSPNTGLARSGTVVIAGQVYTLSQTAPGAPPPECTFALSTPSQSVGAAGGPVPVSVLAGGGCAWTAASLVPWLTTITSGASGAGDGTVELSVEANASSSARTGTATIAGQVFTVNQSGVSSTPCTYGLSATSQSVGAAATSGSVTVTAGSGCVWTATANAAWLSITAGASGTANGTVQFSVAANSVPTPRTGTLTIAGQTFTVNQAAASVSCWSLSSTSVPAPAAAGSSSVDITTTSSCAWTAVANASWLALTSAASGTGNATVSFSIAENTDTSPRSGTLTIAGQTVTVNQAAAAPPSCSYAVSPLTISTGSGSGSSSTDVTTTSSCSWTATSNDSWLTLTGATSGTGNGTVAIGIGANPDPSSRSGTLTVAGQTVTVNQDPAPCTFSLSDTTLSIVAAGDDKTIHVTASASSCAWTASSDVPWMTFTSGASGTGSGDVVVHIDANPDPSPRSGTLTIGGQTVAVTQDAGP